VLYGTTDLLTEASPPIQLRDAVAEAAPRPVLLIVGEAVTGNAEVDADKWIRAAFPDTVQVWVVPDTGHTAAQSTQPQQGGQGHRVSRCRVAPDDRVCALPLLAGENIGPRFVVPTVAGGVDCRAAGPSAARSCS
jgi:hypothetical protein